MPGIIRFHYHAIVPWLFRLYENISRPGVFRFGNHAIVSGIIRFSGHSTRTGSAVMLGAIHCFDPGVLRGVRLSTVMLDDASVVIAAIIRNGVMTLPRGDSTLQADDEIIAVASPEGAERLANLLAFPVYPVRNGKNGKKEQ
jgi:hypothetical protein